MRNKTELYMLDTNTASYIIKGEPPSVRENLIRVPMPCVCISSITQAELLRGVARKPEAKKLPLAVNEFLLRIEVLPWNSNAAVIYADLRTNIEKEGLSLGNMDMLIAAHSISAGAVLVTHDQAFYRVSHHLTLADWTLPPKE